MIRLLFAIALFMGCNANGGTPPSPAFQMTLEGVGNAAAALPLASVATPTDAEWLSLKGVVVSLIFLGAGAAAWAVVAGRNKTQNVRVEAPMPASEAVPQYVTTGDLDSVVGTLATKLEMAEMERGIETKMHLQFQSLDEKRSRSIRQLHEHISGTAKAQAEREEAHTVALHQKINAIAENVAEMRGEMKRKPRA